MRSLMKSIPNMITCLNLFSGALACILAIEQNYTGAFIFIVFAAVFDFLDGFAARLLKAFSPIGKELDSLADVVSFGLAPGLLVFSFLQKIEGSTSIGISIHFLGILIPVFAALRLAKFNIDTRQTDSFLGLPVPANALFWGALIPTLNSKFFEGTPGSGWGISIFILCFTVLFCLLMVSELPMFSLKFKSYGWKRNKMQYFLIILTIILVIFFQLLGFGLCILAYILMSVINKFLHP
ncbi:MAG: CDP-diacylglycerol--serine O-phosphatidyltransferase [Dysgonamonadaceae bacterium]|jgi:CDP-diacylglycerol--serine O-phosphatidyltransferase|nr:CDP-diacylglycerol--serine O-phosphatidyltransferase [Dysgonamonadaceae bacterium]